VALSSSSPRGALSDVALRAPGLQRLEDLLVGDRQVLGELRHRRGPAELRGQLRGGLLDAQRELLQVARWSHGPRLVAEVALDLAEHRGHRERRERDAAVGVEAVDGLQQPEGGDLHDVLERLGLAPVAQRDLPREAHEALDELLTSTLVAVLLEPDEQLPIPAMALGTGGTRRVVLRQLCLGDQGHGVVRRSRESIPSRYPGGAFGTSKTNILARWRARKGTRAMGAFLRAAAGGLHQEFRGKNEP
jgi:hypothetical protein